MLPTDFEFNVLEKTCNDLLSAPYLQTVLHHIVHENNMGRHRDGQVSVKTNGRPVAPGDQKLGWTS